MKRNSRSRGAWVTAFGYRTDFSNLEQIARSESQVSGHFPSKWIASKLPTITILASTAARSMKQFFRSWQTSAIMPSKQNNVCPCEYAHETERWDLPVFVLGRNWRLGWPPPRGKMQLAASKGRVVGIY